MNTSAIMDMHLYEFIFSFYIYSFLGWVMETALCSIRERHFINRGFLAGPLCPIYGFGMCAILLILQPFAEHLVILFFGGMFVASAVEYFTGWLLEALFHAKYWDYSNKKWNLHGKICLKISLAWGFLSVIIVKVIHPCTLFLINKLSRQIGNIVLLVLLLLFLCDIIQSIVAAAKISNKLRSLAKVKEELSRIHTKLEETKLCVKEKKLSEQISELSLSLQQKTDQQAKVLQKHVHEIKQKYNQMKSSSLIERRLLHGNPKMKSIKRDIIIEDLKDCLKKLKR